MIFAVVGKSYEEICAKIPLNEKFSDKKSKSTVKERNRKTEHDNVDPAPQELESVHVLSGKENQCQLISRAAKPIVPLWKCCSWLRKVIRVIAYDPFTELIVAVAAILNTIFLSIDYDGIEEEIELYSFLQKINKVIFWSQILRI